MANVLTELLRWAVHDVIFFSGDVQTTTIAVAITSSLCCSIVVAVAHIITHIFPTHHPQLPKPRYYGTDCKVTKKNYSKVWWSQEKIQVLCSRCGDLLADEGCRFVTCKTCCYSVSSCRTHQTRQLTLAEKRWLRQTQIDLSSVSLHSCPKTLGFLGAQLTCLNLGDNKLLDLPPEIGLLHGLQILTLERNQLETLPEIIGTLAALQCLDLSHNNFHSFPATDLTRKESLAWKRKPHQLLTLLILEFCSVKLRNDCIFNMVALRQLEICHNQIENIPPDISRLKHLYMLNISSNKIHTLCKELLESFQLKVLELENNGIEVLEESIGHLVNLEVLDMSYCKLTSIPATISNCSKLHTLLLSNNRLETLPCEVGKLRNLVKLDVTCNQLQYLPYALIPLQNTLNLLSKDNRLLEKDSYELFTHTLAPDKRFPSLQELTARDIVLRHIPYTNTLPYILQAYIKPRGSCCECSKPLFECYNSEIIPTFFYYCDVQVPLYKLSCPQHSSYNS